MKVNSVKIVAFIITIAFRVVVSVEKLLRSELEVLYVLSYQVCEKDPSCRNGAMAFA